MNAREMARSGRPTPVLMKQRYYEPGAGTGPHRSGTVPSLTRAASGRDSEEGARTHTADGYGEYDPYSSEAYDDELGDDDGESGSSISRRLMQTGSSFTGSGLGLQKSSGPVYVGSSGSARQMLQKVLHGLPQMPQ